MDDKQKQLAWRRCLCGDDGRLHHDGEAVMRDLEEMCNWMRSELPVDSAGRVDPVMASALMMVRGVYAKVRKRVFEGGKIQLNEDKQ